MKLENKNEMPFDREKKVKKNVETKEKAHTLFALNERKHLHSLIKSFFFYCIFFVIFCWKTVSDLKKPPQNIARSHSSLFMLLLSINIRMDFYYLSYTTTICIYIRIARIPTTYRWLFTVILWYRFPFLFLAIFVAGFFFHSTFLVFYNFSRFIFQCFSSFDVILTW